MCCLGRCMHGCWGACRAVMVHEQRGRALNVLLLHRVILIIFSAGRSGLCTVACKAVVVHARQGGSPDLVLLIGSSSSLHGHEHPVSPFDRMAVSYRSLRLASCLPALRPCQRSQCPLTPCQAWNMALCSVGNAWQGGRLHGQNCDHGGDLVSQRAVCGEPTR